MMMMTQNVSEYNKLAERRYPGIGRTEVSLIRLVTPLLTASDADTRTFKSGTLVLGTRLFNAFDFERISSIVKMMQSVATLRRLRLTFDNCLASPALLAKQD